MNKNSDKKLHLRGKQAKGIEALLTTDTIDQAAKNTGVTRNTMYRWLKEDFFLKELNQAKRQVVQHSILKLQKASQYAVKTLLEICRDKNATDSARVSAAREILNNTLKAIELEDIEERIKALENRYLNRGPGRR